MHFGEIRVGAKCKRALSRYCPKRQLIGDIDGLRRQEFGVFDYKIRLYVRFGQRTAVVAKGVLIRYWLGAGGFGAPADFARSRQRVEHARHDL